MQLSFKSLDWALKHIETHGDTDIFPVPFEYQAIRRCWNDYTNQEKEAKIRRPTLRAFLASQEILSRPTGAYRKCLSPKHRFGFRPSLQLDPFDTIIYTAILFDIGGELEQLRIPVSKKVVFSSRFKPDKSGNMFNPDFNYDSFTARSRKLASRSKCTHVLVADIADFYPRIYLHPIETTLSAISLKDHAAAILNMIKQWNFRISFGIPVGTDASRLLAEAVIADVDAALVGEGLTYCRYSDDFRFFCDSESSAYRALTLLANTLFENHGLTLQQTKTRILTVSEFKRLHLETESSTERKTLGEKFRSILESVGIDNPYIEVDYDSLPPAMKTQVDGLNLVQILADICAAGDDIDIPMTRFVLMRLSQLNDVSAVDLVLNNMPKFFPLFKNVIQYFRTARKLDSAKRHSIGSQLINLIRNSSLGTLDFHKLWILNTFADDRQWDNEDEFISLYNALSDEFSRRELICALGRARSVHWFRTRKRNLFQYADWERRAFLAAASCLKGDEADYWYKSSSTRLNELEKAVAFWAKENPFG